MKTALRNTTWLQRIAFYLLALAVLAVAGWSAGAVMLVALVGALALVVWWIASLGWVTSVMLAEEDDGLGSFEDRNGAFSISSSFHDE